MLQECERCVLSSETATIGEGKKIKVDQLGAISQRSRRTVEPKWNGMGMRCAAHGPLQDLPVLSPRVRDAVSKLPLAQAGKFRPVSAPPPPPAGEPRTLFSWEAPWFSTWAGCAFLARRHAHAHPRAPGPAMCHVGGSTGAGVAFGEGNLPDLVKLLSD